jgi:hypothetical protein
MIVLGRGDEDALLRLDQPRELEGAVGDAGAGLVVAVIERKRIVGERDEGDLGILDRQFLGRERRELGGQRARADRPGENENARRLQDGPPLTR